MRHASEEPPLTAALQQAPISQFQAPGGMKNLLLSGPFTLFYFYSIVFKFYPGI